MKKVAFRKPLRSSAANGSLLLALLSCVHSVILSAAADFQFEIIARTETTTTAGNIIAALGTGPSINDAGKVAYKVRTADGREGVFVSGETSSRSSLIDTFQIGFTTFSGLSQNFYSADVVDINNQNQVAWKVWSRDGLFSFIFRLGSSAADFRIVAKTCYQRIDNPDLDLLSPFCGPPLTPTAGLSPWVTVNNSGRVAFSGIQADTDNHFVLATPRDPDHGGSDDVTDFYFSPPLMDVTNFFPQIADNGTIAVRGGRPSTSPIMLFKDVTLNASTATFIATSTENNALGERPGISDDGKVVAFMADNKTQGVGIYFAVIDRNANVLSGPFKVTGFPGFSAFTDKARVGVNHSSQGAFSKYSIVYLAFGPPTSGGSLGPLGLYQSDFDITDPLTPSISPPSLVISVGNTIPNLSEVVQNIALYDPINNNGQLAFWVQTATAQAIVRASIQPHHPKLVLITHGWRSLPDAPSTWHIAMRDAITTQLRIRFPDPRTVIRGLLWSESNSSLDLGAGPLPDWTVVALDWPSQAHSLFPWTAEGNAKNLGRKFGALIQKVGFDSCHLIGHSAGCWLVDGIADTVKNHDSKTGGLTDIHVTFLDAFAQGGILGIFNTFPKLGSSADWAEQYVSKGVAETDWVLPHAFNIDVTHVNTTSADSHSWPYVWYSNSVVAPTSVLAYGWGFQRTLEYSDHHPSFLNYAIGTCIDIATGLPIDKVGGGQAVSTALITLDPASVVTSATGKVSLSGPSEFTMTTGSPVSLVTPLTIADTNTVAQFTYEFLSEAPGRLEVLFDDQPVFLAEEQYSLGVEDSGWQPLAYPLSVGQHSLKFELSPETTNQCMVRISGIQVGYQSAAVQSPILHVQVEQQKVVVLWSDAFPDYSVTTSDAIGGGWSRVGESPLAEGGFLKTVISTPKQSQYFRLER